MENIKIRKVEKKDIEEILELERKFPPKSRRMITYDEIVKIMEENPNACILAEDDWKIRGAIFGKVYRNECKILFLIVDLEKIGEGIAEILMKELLKSTGTERFIK
jgi:N-acetylglutamate synthase-like GNAT family acetyltransferase